ncbi:MAG: hypothetical protein LBT99_00090 [Bifidobacteriaceae bacterium]|jgi:hypothetical protein|nr:hypothetical protein [Bifidobacteriaceae bacterium]
MEIRKFGTLFSIFLFGVVSFISGLESAVWAASPTTVLPASKGGTGQNDLAKVNVGSATKLQNARAINEVNFDGTSNITIGGSYKSFTLYSGDDYYKFTCGNPPFSSTELLLEMVISRDAGGGTYAQFSEKSGDIHFTKASSKNVVYYPYPKLTQAEVYLKIASVTGVRTFSYLTNCNDSQAVTRVTDQTLLNQLYNQNWLEFNGM